MLKNLKRLKHVREFAMKHLLNAQGVMKEQYDKKVEVRKFEPEELVLVSSSYEEWLSLSILVPIE